MLVRSGGAAAIQRVVSKVSDLPSPLDAQPGERIVVRETEEVYAIDATTRMWAVIGTLKKVGGKRPEELAAHLEAEGNPHKTTLSQVAAAGATVQLDEKTGEFTLEDKSGKLKGLLRLLRTGGALRIGPDAGKSNAAIVVNGGKKGAQTPILHVLGETGDDRALLDGDGNLKISGVAEIKGGVKGPTTFADAITALGGINGGDALSISAKKLNLGKLTVTDRGLGIGKEPTEALDVAGNLKISGQVSSDLSPSDDNKLSLGEPKRRWKAISAATLNVLPEADETALVLGLKPGQKAPIILVGTDKVVLDSDGDLGLGTAEPVRKLDVRGSGIAIGSPVGDARVTLADNGDGDVQLSFNRFPDGSPEDDSTYGWTVVPGNAKFDGFAVRRRAKGGDWHSLLQLTTDGLKLVGDLTLNGSIKTSAPLSTNALYGAASLGKNGIAINPNGASLDYFAQNGLYDGCLHSFSGVWKNAQKTLGGLVLSIDDQGSAAASSLMKLLVNKVAVLDVRKDGALFGRSLGDEDQAWEAAYVNKVAVGQTSLTDGTLSVPGDLDLDTGSGVVRMGGQIILRGGKNSIETSSNGLSIEGDKAIYFGTKADGYGIAFQDSGAVISNVGEIGAGVVSTNFLNVNSGSSIIAKLGSKGKSVLTLSDTRMSLNAGLSVGGFSIEKVQETVDVTAARIETKLKLPAGVRVEAVVAQVIEDLTDVRFFQIGDAATPDRFLGASTKTTAGDVSKGLNHCDRGQSVQNVEAPLVITTDAPPSGGKILVTVFYMNPNGSV